jgi:hypothetical protein
MSVHGSKSLPQARALCNLVVFEANHTPRLMALSPFIRFGTSTWTYEGWQGQVYTANQLKNYLDP